MIRPTAPLRRNLSRPLALALAVFAAAAAPACTPRPDEPAAATPSPAGAPAAGATTAPAASPGSAAGAPGGSAETTEAPVLVYVDRIDVMLLKSFPVQVHTHLSGHLSDACVEVAEPEVRREGSTFTITLPATRPPDRMCAQALVPFERTVPLPVRDLPKGEYRIESHGASASFVLDRDNSFNPR